MSEKDTESRPVAGVDARMPPFWTQAYANDIVTGSTPGFALGSMMISASQSQARAMESAVSALMNNNVVGLATTSQCVSRILGAPSQAQQEFIAALQSKMFT